jgi:hypothetical protein
LWYKAALVDLLARLVAGTEESMGEACLASALKGRKTVVFENYPLDAEQLELMLVGRAHCYLYEARLTPAWVLVLALEQAQVSAARVVAE